MFIIGIAGGSGSGKTTFAKKILQKVTQERLDQVVLLHQDSYYLASPANHLRVHGEPNFDHPDAFDWDLMKEQLMQLKGGGRIDSPIYDFKNDGRTSDTESIGPCKVILMEGIYTLWDAEIRNLFDLKIYLDVDADIRFIRRLHRDVRERNRSLDHTIRQYYDTVRPMHHEFLEPTRQYADLVVGEETDIAAHVVAAQIKDMIFSRGEEKRN